MTTVLGRGLLAGAAGTAALNAISYGDMLVRGRQASDVPARTVEALAGAAGLQVPGSSGSDGGRRNRLEALGALSGALVGMGVGVAAAAARAAGLRLPAPLDSALVGAAAMAASDVPAAALGVVDPRTWTPRDWVADAVPHLGYGVAAVASRCARWTTTPVHRASAGLVARAALLGVATGSRSSLGLAAPALTSADTPARPHGRASRASRLLAAAGVAGELAADKASGTPDRTAGRGLAFRLAAAGSGALALARRERATATLPALAGVAGGAAGTWGGLAWRRWAATRVPDWQAAVAEDAVALGLALISTRQRRP